MEDKFKYTKGFGYTEVGGRWFIINPIGDLIDLRNSRGTNAEYTKMTHNKLGLIEAEGDVIKLLDYSAVLDFSSMENQFKRPVNLDKTLEIIDKLTAFTKLKNKEA